LSSVLARLGFRGLVFSAYLFFAAVDAGVIAAAGAGLVALVAVIGCALLARRVRRLTEAQSVVVGAGQKRDVVAHSSELEARLVDLAAELHDVADRLDGQDTALSQRLDGAVAHVAVVRYDAMGEMTGRQSSSVALLDSGRSGVVLSSILHRDHARLYAKQIVAGHSEYDLSPEEEQALEEALRPGRG
jgi:hypothetical protein